MLIAQVLQEGTDIGQTVILTGGSRTVGRPRRAGSGGLAARAARGPALPRRPRHDRPRGPTTPNIVEAETNRALVASATRVVVCADHTKWGVVGLASFGTLADVERVVTDRGLSRAAHEAIGGHGLRGRDRLRRGPGPG